MPSIRYNRLIIGLCAVETQFLDFKEKPLGNYTNKEKLLGRAYVVFAHAEIEQYLEDSAKHLLNKAKKSWSNGKRTGKALAALVAHKGKQPSIADNLNNQNPSSRIETIVGGAIAIHEADIDRNNGIKSNDFSKLFIPLGIDSGVVTDQLLIDLGNIGGVRGDLVHKNHRTVTKQQLNPFDQKKIIENILLELKLFDAYLSSQT